MSKKFTGTIPVLPSSDIIRDIEWHKKHTGFTLSFGDKMYAELYKDAFCIHLQWHADTEEDPLLGGSVVKFFVEDIKPWYKDFVKRGTITKTKLQHKTPWNTTEFGFYDLNKNAIFIVQDL